MHTYMGEQIFVYQRTDICNVFIGLQYVSKLVSSIPSREKLMPNVAAANLLPAIGFCHLLVSAVMDPSESVTGRF